MHAQWSDTNQNFHHFMYRDGFYAAVDVVHLLKVCINFYLTGPGSFFLSFCLFMHVSATGICYMYIHQGYGNAMPDLSDLVPC